MKQKPTIEAQHSQSHLFMVRVWVKDLGNGETEWRREAKHVMNGRVWYFRDWATLADHLQAMLTPDANTT